MFFLNNIHVHNLNQKPRFFLPKRRQFGRFSSAGWRFWAFKQLAPFGRRVLPLVALSGTRGLATLSVVSKAKEEERGNGVNLSGVGSAVTNTFPACKDWVLRGQFYYYFVCDINFKVFIVVAITVSFSTFITVSFDLKIDGIVWEWGLGAYLNWVYLCLNISSFSLYQIKWIHAIDAAMPYSIFTCFRRFGDFIKTFLVLA